MVNELTAIVDELGGEAVVGRSIRSGEDMSAAIREGFQPAVVDALLDSSGLTLQEVATSLDLSTRSLQRRRHQGRLARLLALADYFIGDREKGIAWMKRPNVVLGGIPPLSLLDTELGARQVENVLGRIAYGGVS